MTMMLITFFVVAFTTYLWVTRGFMSAFIHMVCVLAAGAIAFGVWEPVSMFLLNRAPERGFLSALGGLAWGLGLAIPFAVVLAILRVAVDSILPANAQCDSVVDYLGGGVCGLVSGVVSAGIIVLSLGFLRVGPDFWGYAPVEFTSQASRGSLERSESKMVPWVDRITASMYSHLSLTTFRTARPLGIWHPDFETFPASMRYTFDSASRTTLKPSDFAVLGWYNVGDPQRPSSFDGLLTDAWNETRHRITDLHGEPYSQGYLTGLIVQFRAGAREKGGYISVGNGQVRMVVRREGSESTRAIHPIAVITRTADPTQIAYARFRFDSDGFYVASIGGESDALMGFEFPVPAGYRPLALYVKGVRYTLNDKPPPTRTFETPQARDQVIREGKFEGMKEPGRLFDSEGNPIVAADTSTLWSPDPVSVTNQLNFVIQKGTERRMTVSQEGRGYAIEDGDETYSKREIELARQADFRLQINRFAVTADTTMVRVELTPAFRSREFNQAVANADRNAPLELIDTNGRRYQAVGFIFEDASNYRVRYTRGQPIRNLNEMPEVSRNNPDRKLTVLFIVSRGVDVSEFRIGRSTIETYSPPHATGIGQR